MGFANSPTTRNVLAGYGIRVSGYRWRWGLGLKGGTFPPHHAINGDFASDAGDFEALPGEDVNGDTCTCALVPQYRTPDGRFAKPGLQPIFQPPTTAALELYRPPEPLDLSPLVAALGSPQPVNVTVEIPDGAIIVNLPPFEIRMPKQDPPVVNVAGPQLIPPPIVNVSAPVNVDVAPSPAPNVTVSPNIEVKPAPVKIIRDRVGKSVRFFRSSDGKIDKAEVTE